MELNDKELEEYNRLNSKQTNKEKVSGSLKENMSWIMIVLLALMQIVLSCLSTVNGNIQFIFPDTAWGWILLIAPKIAISVLGYMIWSNFFDKGKQNAQKTEEYQKAQDILTKLQGKTTKNIIQVVNPVQWEKQQKIKKGIKLTVSLAITSFIIGELFVAFSIASLVGTLVSLLFSVFWGLQMMTSAEEMYSIGYYRYASLLKIQNDAKNCEVKENALPQENEAPTEPYGAQNEQTRLDVLPGTDDKCDGEHNILNN